VAVAALALALLVGALRGGPAGAQPDFTDVADILNGRRHLLRTDDLVVNFYVNFEGVPPSNEGDLLFTSTSQITSDTPTAMDSGVTTPTVTAARLFDTPYDVAVSAVFGNNNLPCNPQEPFPCPSLCAG
jgi:hypothetical protein